VSKNTALTELNCSQNNISTIDLSANKSLTNLNCKENVFKTLDLTANDKLINLDCRSNPVLTTICLAKLSLVTSKFLKDTKAVWSESCTTVGIETMDVNNHTSLYPNPSNGKLTIETPDATTASITNTLGLQVGTLSLHAGKNDINVILQQGIYYIKLEGTILKLTIE
jgi:hypothetical protein